MTTKKKMKSTANERIPFMTFEPAIKLAYHPCLPNDHTVLN